MLAVTREVILRKRRARVLTGVFAATAVDNLIELKPKEPMQPAKPSKATSLASSKSMSNTCPRCPMRPEGAICLSLLIAPKAGCLCRLRSTRRQRRPTCFSMTCSRLVRSSYRKFRPTSAMSFPTGCLQAVSATPEVTRSLTNCLRR